MARPGPIRGFGAILVLVLALQVCFAILNRDCSLVTAFVSLLTLFYSAYPVRCLPTRSTCASDRSLAEQPKVYSLDF
jgi:hypothetical protein